jgi:trigger factor
MQVKRETLEPTKVKLIITADQTALNQLKDAVINRLGGDLKVAGFRPGKAPANLVEKQLDPASLQNEFLNEAVNWLYDQAIRHEKIRVTDQPSVSITKFVPFSTLEFTAEVEMVGEIKLGDYKTISLSAKPVKVEASEVNTVLNNLRSRAASKSEVKRVSKNGDEVTIDFKGTDPKTKQSISGASGNSYPLVLGSNSFIPGFEEELIGLEAGQSKSFIITFPKDYPAAELKNKQVNFSVSILAVNELVLPPADDKFAASVGPFKSIGELKADIKKQIESEKKALAQQDLDNELLTKIVDKSEVNLPKTLVDQELSRLEDEEKRSLTYRGQTWAEHLSEEGISAEQHRERQRPAAENRIKAGLILGEISSREKIEVSEAELKARIDSLKNQYQDQNMQAELDSEDGQRDIHSRLMIEKTITYLRTQVVKK